MNVIIRVFFITTYWIIQFFYSHLNLYPRNTVCFNYFNSTFPSWWWMSKIRFGDGQLQKVIKPRSSMLLIWCSKLLQHEGYAYIEQEENGQNIDIITIFRSSILCTFGHPSYPWILPKQLPEDDSHISTGENQQETWKSRDKIREHKYNSCMNMIGMSRLVTLQQYTLRIQQNF